VISKKFATICALVFMTVGFPIGTMSNAAPAVGADSPPEVCRGDDGQPKKGDLDVLALLDNSKSLTTSDPDGERFNAIEEFLTSFGKARFETKKNFGLIKFGQTASDVIPLREVTETTSKSIIDDIRVKVPNTKDTQEPYTNYIDALELAANQFASLPESDCKVLIWFTDGVFSINNSSDIENDKSESKKLEKSVCSSGGLASRLQGSRVSTFVVYLTPEPDSDFERRTSASQDAMQAITGDGNPSFGSEGPKDRNPSDICTLGEHLGEVLAASDASQLIGYLVDLVDVAGGGQPVTESPCPFSVSTLSSLEMPSGYFIDWLSVSTWNDGAPNTEDFGVVSGDEEVAFSEVFVADESAGSLERNIRFGVRPGKAEILEPGWKLSISNGEGLCVRAKAKGLNFKISQNDPKIEVVSPPSLPEVLFADDQLSYIGSDGELSFDDALKVSDVKGQLRIEFGKIFDKSEKLPASIEVDGLFRVDPRDCELAVSYNNVENDGNKLSSLNSCSVTPSSNMTTTVDATRLIEVLEKECGVGKWDVIKDGVATSSPQFELAPGTAPVKLAIETQKPITRGKKSCEVQDGMILLSSQDVSGGGNFSGDIRAKALIDILPGTNPIWWLIATVLTLFVTALSLGLLRAINYITSRTPSGNDFYGYIVTTDLYPGELGRAVVKWRGGARQFSANPQELETAQGNPSLNYIGVGNYKFERRLPSVFRPFGAARLSLNSANPAVFWRANPVGDGFGIAFNSALAVIASQNNVPTNDTPVEIQIVALVPRKGINSGYEGVETLVNQRLGDLAPQLFEKLKALEAAKVAESKDSEPQKSKKTGRAKADSAGSETPVTKKVPDGPVPSGPPGPSKTGVPQVLKPATGLASPPSPPGPGTQREAPRPPSGPGNSNYRTDKD
jgi:hypothetical protein